MSLRCPNCRQAVLVGKFGSFDEQFVFVALGTVGVACKVAQAEIQFSFGPGGTVRNPEPALLGMDDDFKTASERPK